MTYSQSVPVLNMSAALSVSRLNYWNAQSNNNYMLSLNKVFSLGDLQGLSASVSFARNQYTGGGSQNQSTPPSVSRGETVAGELQRTER